MTAPLQFNPRNGEIRICVWINRKGPFWMKLDTGATICVISPAAAARAVVQVTGNSTDLGAYGAQVLMASGKIAELKVGHFVLHDAPCAIGDPNEGPDCDGILAGPLFAEYALALDFQKRTIAFYDGGLYSPPAGAVCVPLVFDCNHLPVCKAAVDGMPVTLEVDTGFTGKLELLPDTVGSYHLASTYPRIGTVTMRSVDATKSFGLYRMNSLTLQGVSGEVAWTSGLSAIFDSSFGPFAAKYDYDGRIGTQLLSQYTVTFDYAHARLVFQDGRLGSG